MSITWFKFQHDMPGDIRFRKFSPQQKWAWVVLLCLASQSEDQRGSILHSDEDIADYCDFDSTEDWLFFKDKLRSKGLVEPVPLGLKITDWDKKQATKLSDTPEAARDRKRKQRAKQKLQATEALQESHAMSRGTDRNVTPCHATDKTREDQIRKEEIRKEEIRKDQKEEPLTPKGEFDLVLEAEPSPIEVDFFEMESEVDQDSPLAPISDQQIDLSQAKAMDEDQSSAAPPKKNRKKEKTQTDYDRFKTVYNEEKPPAFAAMQAVNNKRETVFKDLVKAFGSEDAAIDALRDALAEAKRPGSWYIDKNLAFENFASNNKILKLAETWRSRPATSDSRIPAPDSAKADSSALTIPTAAIATRNNAPEDFQRWWSMWSPAMLMLKKPVDDFESAKEVWVGRYGLHAPEGIFEGTEAYIRFHGERFTESGACYPRIATNFLKQDAWKDMIDREAIRQQLPEVLRNGTPDEIKQAAWKSELLRKMHDRKARETADHYAEI